MDWNDLRTFLAVARHGSVRGAGAALSVSHSTVTRRLAALEESLQARLFDRHRDGVTLTEAGERLRGAAERVEDEVNALTRDVAGHDRQLAGTVSLTCSDEYVAALILDDLRPWSAQHPNVALALSTDSRPFDLSRGEADLAVRALGRDRPPPDPLVARRLAPIHLGYYVARAHQGSLMPPAPHARWLAFDDRPLVAQLVRDGPYPNVPFWGAFSSLRLLVRAAEAGLGLAMLPVYVGDAEPALVRLERAPPRHVGDLWLLFHPDLRDNARVRAVRAIVQDGIARRIGLFEGRCEIGPQRSEHAP